LSDWAKCRYWATLCKSVDAQILVMAAILFWEQANELIIIIIIITNDAEITITLS